MYQKEIPSSLEQHRLLYALTCSHDIFNLNSLLKSAVDDKSKPTFDWNMGAEVLEHVSYNAVGKGLIFDFFLDNWQLIYAKIEKEFNMESLNWLISSCLRDHSHRSILQLEYFINDNSTNASGIQRFSDQLNYLKSTRRWINKNYSSLISLMQKQITNLKRGARNAKDKTFQHNGGGSVDIKCFQCQTCGKVYRACGTCGKLKRTVSLTDVKVTNITSAVVAINPSNGDKATIRRITIVKPFTKYTCARSETGLNGAEPKFLGDGPDGKSCLYTKADIIYV
uniref:Probable pectate lyase F n=1 Tax=Ditylenchus dipsaci TaxID=166011 RepID=A0A915DTV0_9BILA